jgi:4-amino-4-deoxy-L-arabinose transferase-like glycosyltransferase
VNTSDADPSFTRWLPILIALLVVAAALRIAYAPGFIPVDDAEYARVAAHILDGTFSRENHTGPPVNHARAGMVLPVVALFNVFGPNEISLAAYPFALSLLTLCLVYAFAAATFGRYAGLIALGIWTFVPLDMDFAARLTPDTPMTAFALLAIFVIYLARLRADIGRAGSFLRGAGAGLAFGAAWLCKESTVYFAPFCLILLCYDLKRDWRRFVPLWAGVAAGSILVFASEMVFYAASTGNWLYRFETIETNYRMYPEFFFNEGAKFGYEAGMPYWKAVLKRILLEGPRAFFLSPEVMYLPFFALIAGLYGIYKKDKQFYFMTLLFVSLLFMFNFSSASLETYQPLPLFFRYFHPLCFVAAVLIGGLLSRLTAPFWSRAAMSARPEPVFWGGVLAAIILVIAGWSTFRTIRDTPTTWASAERSLAATLRPDDRIYTDALSRAGLEFFWKYPQSMSIVNLSEMGADDEVPCNSYVLLNNSYMDWLVANYGMWYTLKPFTLPNVAKDPPSHWQQSWTNGNAALYRVACVAG